MAQIRLGGETVPFNRIAGWLIVSAFMAWPARAAEPKLPGALEDWRGWALAGEEYRQCPWLATPGAAPGSPGAYRCAWPGRLLLSVHARGGEFREAWQVEAESWVPLPGNAEHWPREVTIDGRRGAIVARDGVPHARLGAGEHVVAGRFAWAARPESLAVPRDIGLVELSIEGTRVDAPTRTGDALLLGAREETAQAASFDIDVHRLLGDGIPVQLVTRLTLRATGGSREVSLGPVLPAGFVPIALDSPLPARVDPEGHLRVQLRAGEFTIELTARATGDLAKLSRPEAAAPWPEEETWSWAGDDRLRVAALEGGEGIDPAQANVPQDWRQYPAARVAGQAVLAVVERSRGMAGADGNRLSLVRSLWLDFDHAGFTAVDHVTGSLRTGWRLDMATPWSLGSARLDDEQLLVTRGATDTLAGVELRSPEVSLQAVARSAGTRGALPATGWSTRFESVSGQLNLPPGHRLVAALGVDTAPGAWLERWGLWNLFGVLIVAVFAGWLGGWAGGVLAFVALVLTYQDAPQSIWLWANLLAALALARAAPEGRLRSVAVRYRAVSFAVLALVLVPYSWQQLRYALHPQLEGAGPTLGVMAPPVAPPPPAPLREMAQDAPVPSTKMAAAISDSLVVAAAKRVERYAPGTIVQAGPGIPAWQYRSYAYSWSGPVEPTQTARFVIAGPVWTAIWRVAGVLLLAAFYAWLLAGAGPWLQERLPSRLRAAFVRGVVPWLLVAGPLLLMAAAPVSAQLPDAQLLGELKARLTKPAACLPTCAEMLAVRVEADASRLTLTFEASALTQLGMPVPATSAWLVDRVTVDGAASPALRRGADDTLWVPLEPGAHSIAVSGRIAPADTLQLVFPWSPKSVTVSAAGWDVTGAANGRLPGGSLDLARRRDKGAAAAGAATTGEATPEFPPFARVVRHFSIGTDRRVETRVQRLSPARAAFSLPIPLIEGESVLSQATEVRDGRAALAVFAAGQDEVAWEASLPRVETLGLVAPPADARYVEVWEFSVSPQWHPTFEGFAATLPANLQPGWVFEFHPRPGEQLAARFIRPAAVPGASLAVEAVERTLSIGKRATDATLAVRYRATQGGRHVVKLPADARVTGVSVDGGSLALRPENGELYIPILPGEHALTVTTTQARGVAAVVRPGTLDLGAAASNVTTTLELPADRWPLYASGSGVGPAILYWSELVAFLLTAWFVGRSGRSPLATHEWVLLGLGLSTLSWGVLALVALWLFAMQWRAQWAGDVSRVRFNFVQVALAALTFFAVTSLLFSGIRDGLLSSPDMGVAGPGSYGGRFSWFVDRTGGVLPQPMVVSLPLWVFKAFVFAWAVWAAFAVLRWLRSAWHAWRSNGYWR
ncbi:MAG: hypothetical protein AB7P31_00880 [Steroidobacteraceae bacterium]